MNDYYARLDRLCERLIESGLDVWAADLEGAVRSASMSGEALSTSGVILRRMGVDGVGEAAGLTGEIRAAFDEGDRLWYARGSDP